MYGWSDTDMRLLERFRNRFGRLFSDFPEEERPLLEGSRSGAERAFPPLDLREDAGTLYVECELPGVHMDDLEVAVVGRDLMIKGERKPPAVEGATFHRREREAGSFHRVVRLPVDVDSGSVNAELRRGVLTVTLPKSRRARPRRIEVKGAAN